MNVHPEAVERVAREAYRYACENFYPDWPKWEAAEEKYREHYRKIARGRIASEMVAHPPQSAPVGILELVRALVEALLGALVALLDRLVGLAWGVE